MKKIVIIGAGYAGVLTAKKLAKRLKKRDDVTITIIDKNPFHTILTELHEVAAGRVDEDSIKISLKKVFAGRKVDVKMDTVQSIDFNNRLVSGLCAQYEYDILVLAAGSRPTYFGVTGADINAFQLWSYEDAVKLKEHILHCFRKAACETDPEEKKKLLTFYVVGAGFTGTEMVGELAEYVPILCDQFEIDRSQVQIYNVDILPRVVPILPEKLSDKITRRLHKMGVSILLNTGVVSIGEDYIEMKIGDSLRRDSTRTVIWVAGIESAEITTQAAKTLPSAKRGRILSDAYLRSTENDSVYIVGDNLYYTPPGSKDVVPQMVENCEQSADVAAHNIVCAVTGTGQMKEYRPKFHSVMVCVGGRYGVARVGTEKRMINLPSFLAMFVKHFINIIYFIQVLGWNKVFGYLKHEFFTIRHNRSFVGGHFSNKTPSFLLVPLRIWLGAVWLFEGIMKIVEGWFTSPMLKGFFGGANSWYNSILDNAGAIAQTASDAVSSAMGGGGGEVAASVGHVIFNIDFLGLFKAIFVCGKDLANATLADYAFKLDVPLMNWFVNNVILSGSGIQIAMQIFIVLAEILVGLSLIGRLFTTPSSAFSLVLQVMFVCTTGLYLNTFWMIFAAIALLIASGRVFGLDYYVIPALKRGWRKLPVVRKLYIYHD